MDNTVVGCAITFNGIILGVPEVSANLYCNSHTSVLGRLRDYLRLLMKLSVYTKLLQLMARVVPTLTKNLCSLT